jgi:hypothetical protein
MKYNLSNRSTLKSTLVPLSQINNKLKEKERQLTILGIPTVKYRPAFPNLLTCTENLSQSILLL